MKNIATLFIVFILAVVLFLWLYLTRFATKADVFTREKTYSVHLPLRLKELPKNTGDVQGLYESYKATFSGDVQAVKTTIKDEFTSRLDNLKEQARIAAKKKADELIDAQFGTH